MNKIIIDAQEITINDRKGNEIVKWVDDEWIEDPSVTVSIANAINIIYTEGEDTLKQTIKNDVITYNHSRNTCSCKNIINTIFEYKDDNLIDTFNTLYDVKHSALKHLRIEYLNMTNYKDISFLSELESVKLDSELKSIENIMIKIALLNDSTTCITLNLMVKPYINYKWTHELNDGDDIHAIVNNATK